MKVLPHFEARDPAIRGAPAGRMPRRNDGRVPEPPVVRLPMTLADALCRAAVEPDLWAEWTLRDEAAAVCRDCPVIAECGEWADATGARGTWGGRWHGSDPNP